MWCNEKDLCDKVALVSEAYLRGDWPPSGGLQSKHNATVDGQEETDVGHVAATEGSSPTSRSSYAWAAGGREAVIRVAGCNREHEK